MGKLRFRIPEHAQFDPRFWNAAYVATAIEGIPKPSEISFDDSVLNLDFEADDTCKFSIPWPTKDYGPIVLTTTSLKNSLAPYSLRLELARGTIHRIRTRAFDWEHLKGLRVPASYNDLMEQSLENFVQAVVEESSGASSEHHSQIAIDKAIDASRALARAYTSQILQVRTQGGEKLQTLFGVHLPAIPQWKNLAQDILVAGNSVSIDLGIHRIPTGENRLPSNDPVFEQLDWANEHELKVIGGPLVSLQEGKYPEFFDDCNSFEQLFRNICNRVGSIVSQCVGRVRLWDASSSFNACGKFQLNDEQAFRLASGVIGTIRSVDTKSPIVFSVNYPAAEYMSKPYGNLQENIDPFRFARSLIQAHDRDIAGIGLDLNLNCWPNGTLPRDLIDLSDIIDHWQDLEKSLLVRLTAPQSAEPDSSALFQESMVSTWAFPKASADLLSSDGSQETDPDMFGTQAGHHIPLSSVARSLTLPPSGLELLQLLLAKPSVHGVIWNQVSDEFEHQFPNAGLFDVASKKRPVFDCMARLRQQYIA